MSDKILIADGNPIDRVITESILKQEGYDVYIAGDGESALATARRERPDMILLDARLSGITGYEVLSFLESEEETADLPVIFLSSLSETEDKVKGLGLGGLDYITKPFDRDELLARLEAHLKRIHVNRRLIKANRELQSKQRDQTKDLEAAAEIQRTLLPKTQISIRNLDIAWKCVPCENVGGDIFNFFRLDENHWAIYILDVTGHGVSAAMASVSISQMMDPNTGHLVKAGISEPPYYKITSPAEVMLGLDRAYPMGRFGRYFSISYMILNIQTGELHYSNAAHPYPLLVRASGEVELLKTGGTIIGLGGILPFEEEKLTLNRGDKMFLYTDGITEHRDNNSDFYGDERFYREAATQRRQPVANIIDHIISSVMGFSDQKPNDDVSLMAFEYVGDGDPA